MNSRPLPVFLALGAICSNLAAQAAPAPAPAPAPATVPAPAPAPAPSPQPTDEMLAVYGWFLGQQMDLFSLGLSEKELAAVMRGVAVAARGEESPANLETVGPSIQAFLESRPAEVQEKRLRENKAEQEKYFAELDGKPAIKKSDSGLRYEILSAGSGVKPSSSDTVVAHYTGRFIDGTVFDSSIDRGEPVEFPLNGVIEGWQEGLQLIGVGGRIKLFIPGSLAYGETGRGNIPPGKTLVFEVELVDVIPAPPQVVMPPSVPMPIAPP